MGKEYLKADERDYEELVDFINYVFSHSGGKTDFPSLLPKVYTLSFKNSFQILGNV